MPLTISTWAIAEKNKTSQSNCWLLAMEISIPDAPGPPVTFTTVRVVANNGDVTWAGHIWQALPFEIDEIGENSKGEVPRVDVRICNVSRIFEYYLQEYDTFTKTYGYTPITVKIMVINTGNLANTTPEVCYEFDLNQPKTNSQWATFTLGASNPYRKRFPEYRILKNQCQYKSFKGIECGYAGAETVCDRTLSRCKALNNSGRYGGFPGAGDGALRV